MNESLQGSVLTQQLTASSEQPTRASSGTRSRRRLRLALDVALGLLMLCALLLGAPARGDVLQCWLLSLVVLPYLGMDERFLGRVAVGQALLALGLALIGFALIDEMFGPAARGVSQGVLVALVGAHHLLRLRGTATKAQPYLQWFPVAELLVGSLWLWLGVR
jgi:hypothetical protein